MKKWYIKQDRYKSIESDEIDSWTITTDPEYPGWNTDSGYYGYGLPKELAQWICDRLNESGKDCHFKREQGFWVKD